MAVQTIVQMRGRMRERVKDDLIQAGSIIDAQYRAPRLFGRRSCRVGLGPVIGCYCHFLPLGFVSIELLIRVRINWPVRATPR